MYDEHRNLFVIWQSEGCKFMSKMHQNTFCDRALRARWGSLCIPPDSVAAKEAYFYGKGWRGGGLLPRLSWLLPVGDVSHKPGGKLPLLSARPAVTPATLKRAATNFAGW